MGPKGTLLSAAVQCQPQRFKRGKKRKTSWPDSGDDGKLEVKAGNLSGGGGSAEGYLQRSVRKPSEDIRGCRS